MIFNCTTTTTYCIVRVTKEGKELGKISIEQTDKECLLYSLEVSYTKYGVGLSLIKKAEEKVAKLGYNEVYLYAEKEKWVHEWYKSIGYQDTDELTSNDIYVKLKKKL